MFSTNRGAQFSGNPLSYASFSTASTFSSPCTLAASCAIDLAPLPATNPWTEPPSFWPAVTAPSEPEFSLPSFCSRIASVERSRARDDEGDWVRGHGRARTARKADCLPIDSMVSKCKALEPDRKYESNANPRNGQRRDKTRVCLAAM
jgi:hypothetical protein